MKYLAYVLLGLLLACSPKSDKEISNEGALEEAIKVIEYNNPPAEGFNQEGSDMIAMLLADKTMEAMGGRKAWDESRFIAWNFFGIRAHTWDKATGDIRIEHPNKAIVILMNIHSKNGKAQRAGNPVPADSLDFYLDLGYKWWVNDSYWLFMPFKLKDSGVTLRYIREDTTLAGDRADVIALNFENVGVTPDNIYLVWIDMQSKLVTQWAYYPDSSAAKPKYMNLWTDYEKYGNILLSSGRGNMEITDIKVLGSVPDGTFTDFTPVTL